MKTIDKILVFLFIVLLSFILFFVYKKIKSEPEEKIFEIRDECSNILGNVIKIIRDPELCEARCKNECESRKGKFNGSEFYEIENSCNKCSCKCLM